MLKQMVEKSNLHYSLSLITTKNYKKNFSTIAQEKGLSHDTIRRQVPAITANKEQLKKYAQEYFGNTKTITLIMDETQISKPYSEYIEGTGDHYHTKQYRRIRGYKLLVTALCACNITLPFDCEILYDPVFAHVQNPSRNDLIKHMILNVQSLFPDKKIRVAADGAFATQELLQWAAHNKIAVDVRMHCNRVVEYKCTMHRIDTIKKLIPRGSKQTRTIQVMWHTIKLYITACKRTDKHGKETIIYLASTYHHTSSEHARQYKKRWNIEKIFRTCKQSLGMNTCMSNKYEKHFGHITSVLLAYTIAQLYRKKYRLKIPEDAIRDIQLKYGRL